MSDALEGAVRRMEMFAEALPDFEALCPGVPALHPDNYVPFAADLALLLAAARRTQEAERERDEARAELEWPWAFPPIDMADASVLAIRAWNDEGPEDERLAEEVDALRLNLGHLRREQRATATRAQAAEARVAVLAAALEPFAKACETEERHGSWSPGTFWSAAQEHFRLARAALSPPTDEAKG